MLDKDGKRVVEGAAEVECVRPGCSGTMFCDSYRKIGNEYPRYNYFCDTCTLGAIWSDTIKEAEASIQERKKEFEQ